MGAYVSRFRVSGWTIQELCHGLTIACVGAMPTYTERRIRRGHWTLAVSPHAQARMIERQALLPARFNMMETAEKVWNSGALHTEVRAGQGFLCFERRSPTLLVLCTFSPAQSGRMVG